LIFERTAAQAVSFFFKNQKYSVFWVHVQSLLIRTFMSLHRHGKRLLDSWHLYWSPIPAEYFPRSSRKIKFSIHRIVVKRVGSFLLYFPISSMSRQCACRLSKKCLTLFSEWSNVNIVALMNNGNGLYLQVWVLLVE
jgi:hypothetical protein